MLSWIPLEYDSSGHLFFTESSVIESLARRVDMPRDSVTVGPNHIQLTATKLGGVHVLLEGELNEQAVHDRVTDSTKSLGIILDNMCLGAQPHEDVKTVSLYHRSNVNRFRIDRDDPYNVRSLVHEVSEFTRYTSSPGSRVSVIAHPEFRKYIDPLRKDRIGEDTLIHWSWGCRRSQSGPSDAPSGSPLLFIADTNSMLLGVRSGPEAAIREETELTKLFVRARRAFDVIPDAIFHCVEMV